MRIHRTLPGICLVFLLAWGPPAAAQRVAPAERTLSVDATGIIGDRFSVAYERSTQPFRAAGVELAYHQVRDAAVVSLSATYRISADTTHTAPPFLALSAGLGQTVEQTQCYGFEPDPCAEERDRGALPVLGVRAGVTLRAGAWILRPAFGVHRVFRSRFTTLLAGPEIAFGLRF